MSGEWDRRAYRGRGNGKRYYSDRVEQAGPSRGNPRGRGGHPGGLRGRDIGLYYRDMAVKKREERKQKATSDLVEKLNCAFSPELQSVLMNVIEKLKGMEYEEIGSNSDFLNQYFSNLEENLKSENDFFVDTESERTENYQKDVKPIVVPENEFGWNAEVNEQLRTELLHKTEIPEFENMLKFRKKLPAYKMRDEIVNTVNENQVLVISGETGCGKTTQVAQFILDSEVLAGRGSVTKIICTQPRRISAIGVAERVAQERAEKLGVSVGYWIRLENRSPSRASGTCTFMTTGILFQLLRSNKNLEGISHLILDEIHERTIHSDFLICLLKDIVLRRPSLKVILMSATLNASEFSVYFGGAPTLEIPGFTFPVTEYFLEDAIERTQFDFSESGLKTKKRDRYRSNRPEKQYEQFISEYLLELRETNMYSEHVRNQLSYPACEEPNVFFIEELLHYICRTDESNGAILVFLTGWDMISKLSQLLESSGRFPSSRYRIFPLHSMMPTVNQRQIFDRPPPGVRKIVLATQIAETSITIDDVVFVVDCGKIKISNYDESCNLATLDVQWVSKANATQRRGRAGRVQEGVVYHLFSRARQKLLDAYQKPEILRSRLEEVILQVKILELGRSDFLLRLLNPPTVEAIDNALERLIGLHAITAGEQLTPLGFHLARLPMDPETGKMILMSALFSCVDPVFSIAACLSFKDPFYIPLGKEGLVDSIRQRFSCASKSDHIMYVNVLKEYEKELQRGHGKQFAYENFLSEGTLKMLLSMKKQFAEYLNDLGFLPHCDWKSKIVNRNSENYGIVKAITAAGLFPNVAVIDMVKQYGTILHCNGQRTLFHPSSINSKTRSFESPYIVFYKKVKSSDIYIHDATMVNPSVLIFYGGQLSWDMEDDSSDEIAKVTVDGQIQLAYPKKQNFRFIMDTLRSELDNFMDFKVSNPGPVDYRASSKENLLISSIIKVLTSEQHAFQPTSEDDDDRGASFVRNRRNY